MRLTRFTRYLLLALVFNCAPTVLTYADSDDFVSVAGTTWAGTDSFGSYYEFMFQPSGALHYKSPAGEFKNANWKQTDRAIYFEINDKYSEYRGRIDGETMSGEASNKAGRKWTWLVKKKSNTT
jgi:hypothetical protein